ncbi:MAG: hypothetical protein J1G02_06050 [Clostridiales bacterium]|nr:hypothetical protein [Clostridiales bacterium]
MKKNEIKSIEIYFDPKSTDYFVRICVAQGQELPGFDEMSPEQKQILYNEFPELAKLGKRPSEEAIEEYIDPKIKLFNERSSNSVRTKWKLFKEVALESINQTAVINRLERQLGSFVATSYDGSADDGSIVQFIRDFKNNAKAQYLVFYCDSCKHWEYGKLVNRKVRCSCGNVFTIESEDVYSFTGEYARIKAAELAIEKNNGATGDGVTAEPKARSFYYRGGNYGLSLQEFKALHDVLYYDCAVDSVFTTDEQGRIKFQPDYEGYLHGISDKNINDDLTDLYRRKGRIIAEINSASNEVCGTMSGFYWYFKEYNLTKSRSLHWRVDKKHYRFDTPEEYVESLCSVKASERDALLSLYNSQTCQYFFKGYDGTRIELSRLIYEKTGKFVYIDENGAITDFGHDFIRKLSAVDDMIATKNEFITAIYDDEAYWNQIKGSFDRNDGYWSTADETYYDRLCYYQFAIQGKTTLNYRSLQIRNSKDGMEYIRSIVTNAYQRNDELTRNRFADLLKLIFKTTLLDKLVFRNEGIVKVGQSPLPLIDNLSRMLAPADASPDIKAYLFCLNTVDKKVKFMYKGRLDTIAGHAKYFNSITDGNRMLDEYLESEELKILLQYIFADRYEAIVNSATQAFNSLKQQLDDLRRSIDKQIQQISFARITSK